MLQKRMEKKENVVPTTQYFSRQRESVRERIIWTAIIIEIQENIKEEKNRENLQSLFSDLKRKIDLVKIRSKKIKCLVDSDNILEEMNRLFEILKDNLRDIYQNQLIMRTMIQKIKIPTRVNRSVKLSFAKEMQKAIEVL